MHCSYTKRIDILLFLKKTYEVGTHKKCLIGVLLTNTHDMFSWRNEIVFDTTPSPSHSRNTLSSLSAHRIGNVNVNTHETTDLSADPCQSYQSRELKTVEKHSYFLKMFFCSFSFHESLKRFLNGKKCIHFIFNK